MRRELNARTTGLAIRPCDFSVNGLKLLQNQHWEPLLGEAQSFEDPWERVFGGWFENDAGPTERVKTLPEESGYYSWTGMGTGEQKNLIFWRALGELLQADGERCWFH